MYLFIIVGSLAVGILAVVIVINLIKNSGVPFILDKLTPGSNDYSPREISIQMVKAVCQGQFLMHLLTNKAPPFNDDEYLGKYKSYIKNPSVIAFIQNVKGGHENE
jgi:hypothetical protein